MHLGIAGEVPNISAKTVCQQLKTSNGGVTMRLTPSIIFRFMRSAQVGYRFKHSGSPLAPEIQA